ncbi:MAG: type VI secretion system baseplate subunit TssG [Acidobacteria bacterium]|nr:type VI secretion system baseplate subunit TssG [Acidobacteriota bacterium]
MAGPNRFNDSDLRRYPVFQAIRYLSLLAEDGRLPVGHFHPPAQEAVRLRNSARLSHPPNDIESADLPPGEAPALTTTGFGLFGSGGELPYAWSSYALDRLQRGDSGFLAFTDIFHHRLLSFLYRAWQSPRFPTLAEAGEPNPLDGFLDALLGLSSAGCDSALRPALHSCAPLLLPRPRPAEALLGLLSYYFDVPVSIEQFRGGWRPFEPDQLTRLDDEAPSPDPCRRLGQGAALGTEAWDPQAAIRICLGPMSRARYEEFLPGAPAFVALRHLVDFFSRGAFDYEINPILRREDVPPIRLGEALPPASPQYQTTEVRLGYTTWLTSKPMDRDAGDTVLRAWLSHAIEDDHEPARTCHQAQPGRP